MGVNTVAFIATNETNVFRIVKAAEVALRAHLRVKAPGANLLEQNRNTRVDTSISSWGRMVALDFSDDGKGRSLTIHFDCHSDYAEIHQGRKIILSLGRWGNSVELIQVAGRAIAAELNAPLWWAEADTTDNWVCDNDAPPPKDSDAEFLAVCSDWVEQKGGSLFASRLREIAAR